MNEVLHLRTRVISTIVFAIDLPDLEMSLGVLELAVVVVVPVVELPRLLLALVAVGTSLHVWSRFLMLSIFFVSDMLSCFFLSITGCLDNCDSRGRFSGCSSQVCFVLFLFCGLHFAHFLGHFVCCALQ